MGFEAGNESLNNNKGLLGDFEEIKGKENSVGMDTAYEQSLEGSGEYNEGNESERVMGDVPAFLLDRNLGTSKEGTPRFKLKDTLFQGNRYSVTSGDKYKTKYHEYMDDKKVHKFGSVIKEVNDIWGKCNANADSLSDEDKVFWDSLQISRGPDDIKSLKDFIITDIIPDVVRIRENNLSKEIKENTTNFLFQLGKKTNLLKRCHIDTQGKPRIHTIDINPQANQTNDRKDVANMLLHSIQQINDGKKEEVISGSQDLFLQESIKAGFIQNGMIENGLVVPLKEQNDGKGNKIWIREITENGVTIRYKVDRNDDGTRTKTPLDS